MGVISIPTMLRNNPRCFRRVFVGVASASVPCGQADDAVSLMAMTARKDGAKESSPLVDFGEALRAARAEKKVTQEQLADAIGVTQSMVSVWESGETASLRTDRREGGLRPSVVFRIEEILKVPGGALSHHLGYLPLDFAGRRRPSFEEFLMTDEDQLSEDQKRTLRELYRLLTGPEVAPRSRRRRS